MKISKFKHMFKYWMVVIAISITWTLFSIGAFEQNSIQSQSLLKTHACECKSVSRDRDNRIVVIGIGVSSVSCEEAWEIALERCREEEERTVQEFECETPQCRWIDF